MRKIIGILFVAIGIVITFSISASAQTTNIFTVTNVVTVLVTNIVTVTNVVIATPAPAAPADVPTLATPPAKIHWESSLSAGLTLTRGNSDTLLTTGAILTEK